jgi:surface protein
MMMTFYRAGAFNQPIGTWDTSNVFIMQEMFQFNEVFNQDISRWKTGKVFWMTFMFYDAKAFNQNLSSWDVSSVVDSSNFAIGATSWRLPKPRF